MTNQLWYRQTCNVRRTLVGNEIADHSDVVGASPVGAAPTTSLFSTWLQWIGKGNCKTRRQSFKLSNLVRLILEILRYLNVYGTARFLDILTNARTHEKTDLISMGCISLFYTSRSKFLANERRRYTCILATCSHCLKFFSCASDGGGTVAS